MDRTVCGNIERKNKKLYRSVCLTKDRQRNSKDVGGGGVLFKSASSNSPYKHILSPSKYFCLKVKGSPWLCRKSGQNLVQ